MSSGSYILERDGRRYEVSRGLGSEVIQELTPEQVAIYNSWDRGSSMLLGLGTVGIFSVAALSIRRRAQSAR